MWSEPVFQRPAEVERQPVLAVAEVARRAAAAAVGEDEQVGKRVADEVGQGEADERERRTRFRPAQGICSARRVAVVAGPCERRTRESRGRPTRSGQVSRSRSTATAHAQRRASAGQGSQARCAARRRRPVAFRKAETRALRGDRDEVRAAILVEVGDEQAGDGARASSAPGIATAWNRPRRSLRIGAEGLAVGREDQVEVAVVVEVECGDRRVRRRAAAEGVGIGPGCEGEREARVAGRSAGATASGAQFDGGRPGTAGGLPSLR